MTEPRQVTTGDRFVYTTLSGRRAHYEITETGVVSRNGTEGCVTLVADEPGFKTVTCRPSDLRMLFWAREES